MTPTISCPVFARADSRDKNRPAIRQASRVLSYLELDQLISQSVQHLKFQKVRRHQRVALLVEREVDFIVLYFALLRLGATACLLSPRLPGARIRQEYERLRCRVLVSREKRPRRLLGIQSFTTDQLVDRDPSTEANHSAIEYQLNQTSNIMLTSGSSGQPKAVVHSVGNHYYSALGSNIHIPVTLNSIWLLSLPIYHVSGLSIVWRMSTAGGSVYIPSKNEGVLDCVREQPLTNLSLVAAQVRELLKDRKARSRMKSMRGILIGGSAVPDDLKQKIIRSGIPAYLSYGLTEMSSQVATTRLIRSERDLNSAEVLKYRRVRIDQTGRVCVGGETLFKGYEVNGRLKPSVSKDGFFQTGDLGRFSLLKYLRIVGRADTMFISGGENIFPEEIERCLLEMPEIASALIVPVSDRTYGFRPAALIDVRSGQKISRVKLQRFLKKRLESFKVPDEFYRMPVQTVSGIKTSRHDLVRQVQRQRHKLRKIR